MCEKICFGFDLRASSHKTLNSQSLDNSRYTQILFTVKMGSSALCTKGRQTLKNSAPNSIANEESNTLENKFLDDFLS